VNETARVWFGRKPKTDEGFAKLRSQLFSRALAASVPSIEGDGGSPEVLGVVIEIGMAPNTILVYGLRDGTASVYRSTGGGYVGGRDRPRVNAAAKALVAAAREMAKTLPRVTEHPLPSLGRVRISILTTEGVHAAEDDEKKLMSGQGALYPLFLRGNDITTGFLNEPRPAPADQPPPEALYVMGLFTALARGHVPSVTLFEDEAPPELATLTYDVRDLEWFESLRLSPATLSTGGIIMFVCTRAGFRDLANSQIESSFRVRLQSYRQPPSEIFLFRVKQREREGRFGVELALVSN
jgi:hypothetical protein